MAWNVIKLGISRRLLFFIARDKFIQYLFSIYLCFSREYVIVKALLD